MFMTLLRFGFLFGLVLGHVDILTRVAHLNVEWFEFYQSILLSVVFWSVICPVLGMPILLLVNAIRKERLSAESLATGLRLLLIASPLILIVWMLLQIAFLGALKNLQGAPEGAGSQIFFLTLLFAAVLIPVLRKLSGPIESLLASKLARATLSNYRFFICFFCCMLLGYDLYLETIVRREPVKAELKKEDAPNVMLLVLDTMRADHLGFYGYDKPTSPFLDSLAEKSVVFERASTMSSWTLPSHASMFTGMYSFRHGAHRRHQKLADSYTTLAEILRDRGYATSGYIGGPYCKGKYGIGQGFQTYKDRLDFFEYKHIEGWASVVRFVSFISNSLRDLLLQTDGERLATEANRDMLAWLDRNGDRPFFTFVNYFDVHDPYNLGEEYRSIFTNETRDYEVIDRELQMFWTDPELRFKQLSAPADSIAYLKAIYDMEIRWLDERLKELVAGLESKGLLENTILIITSDHGEEFFEHGGVLHGNTLFEEVIRAPLLVYWPEKLRARRVQEQIGTVDLFRTILELTGTEIPEGTGPDSVSFAPLLLDQVEAINREPVLSQRYPQVPERENRQAAFTAFPEKLILVDKEYERTRNSYFNLKNDPGEQSDLIGQESPEWNEELRSIVNDKFEVEAQLE